MTHARTVATGALATALALHLVALYLPGSPEPGPELFPHVDKLVHVALFAAPAYLIARLTSAWWPLLLLALHAPVSELVQHLWIPYRGGDPFDALADIVGVALGLGLARLHERNRIAVS